MVDVPLRCLITTGYSREWAIGTIYLILDPICLWDDWKHLVLILASFGMLFFWRSGLQAEPQQRFHLRVFFGAQTIRWLLAWSTQSRWKLGRNVPWVKFADHWWGVQYVNLLSTNIHINKYVHLYIYILYLYLYAYICIHTYIYIYIS